MNKKQLIIYASSGFGVNLLNLIVSSYLCDALMTEGFKINIQNWTYENKTLIVASLWSIMILMAKVIDGVIDIPCASWSDRLITKWGRRKSAILVGFIPLIISYICFLFPLTNDISIINTIWFGIMLCIFYTSYSQTMTNYYATFSEVTKNNEERIALSNYKAIFDVLYFILGYTLIPFLISSMNIRKIALILLPLSLTMIIPFIMIKGNEIRETKEITVNLKQSIKYVCQNKSFVIWLLAFASLQASLQLFLVGQNVYFSGVMNFSGQQITIAMASLFVSIPFTMIIYKRIVKKFGLMKGYQFALVMFVLAMSILWMTNEFIEDIKIKLLSTILCGIIASSGVGCFFSIGYSMPSILYTNDKQKNNISNAAMYFAIQGLICGIAVGISTGLIWIILKKHDNIVYMPLISIIGSLISLLLTYISKDIYKMKNGI